MPFVCVLAAIALQRMIARLPERLGRLRRPHLFWATGALVLLIGTWWAVGVGGLLFWIGAFTMLSGAALIVLGIQRARFRIPGQGPGVVQVTEGQVAYFGPLSGGAVALSDLSRLQIRTDTKPGHWMLSQPGRGDLYIPLTADGAETLFDAFARLPGLRPTQERLASPLLVSLIYFPCLGGDRIPVKV